MVSRVVTLDASTIKKLSIYASAGVGTALLGSSVDADIVYTDLRGGNEIIINTANQGLAGIDLDNDGNLDFQINFTTSFLATFTSHQRNVSFLAAAGAPAVNAVVGQPPYLSYMLGNSVLNLSDGATISGANFFSRGHIAANYEYFLPSLSFGQFQQGTIGYVGVRFEDGLGNTVFGWVELQNNGDLSNGINGDEQVMITRFAYATGGGSIAAGQLPEPSALTSIGLLALGAAGIMYRRKKNRSSDAVT